MPDVTVPFGPLRVDEVVKDVVAQSLTHQDALLEFIKRLAEISGKLVDPEVSALTVTHLVDVLVDRRPRVQFLLNSVKARA